MLHGNLCTLLVTEYSCLARIVYSQHFLPETAFGVHCSPQVGTMEARRSLQDFKYYYHSEYTSKFVVFVETR